MRIGLWDPLFTTGRERAPIIITARLTFLSFSLRKKTGKMQAAMSMNTIALGGIARPTARVAAKKSVFGMPVPGKSTSGFSVRRTVAPATVAMAVESKADPIMEPPFKGITDDIKARAPLILDDFKQGISTKSLVRDPFIFPWIFLWIPRELSARSAHDAPRARARNVSEYATSRSNSISVLSRGSPRPA